MAASPYQGTENLASVDYSGKEEREQPLRVAAGGKARSRANETEGGA